MIKRLILLLLSCFLCCASFAACAKSEDALSSAYKGPEPSVEVEASPSPTPEPRTEVEIPEELKFCDEPLYYGMTIEEIREIFGQEDETSEREFGDLAGKHIYYKYNNAQCQGRQVQLQFRIFNYDGVVIPKSYGLDAVVIRWPDILEEQASFVNEEIRPIMENLYGEPDSVREDGIIRLFWDTDDSGQVTILGKLADGPEITIETWRVRFWKSVGKREEAAAYKESGKQGVTSNNLGRLKIGMTFDQAEILLGPYTERTTQYKVGSITYATFVWENEELWNVRITLEIRAGKVNAIYSSGL
ncbi:hypothetical protein AALG83_06145 [Christensenellaceae bacterium 44-20]